MSHTSLSLSKALPKPKYTGEEEEARRATKGPRIVAAGTLDSSALTLKRSGPPPYEQRSGWRPRDPSDFGDGGAFPEVPVVQYPLDLGRDKSSSTSNALQLRTTASGGVDYGQIARRGHSDDRVIHTDFKALIPLRNQAEAGDLDLSRPSAEEAAEEAKATEQALQKLVSGAVAAQKPKTSAITHRDGPTYVSYTPGEQMGGQAGQKRIMKIVQRQQDPLEPPKHKIKKIPRGPPSPPPPVMHSPPRKLTAEDQAAWKIPPSISNWKNPKGYTVPLDKRLASDGRGLQDVTINDKFASFAEALFTADRHAREEVKQRAFMQQKLAEKEKLQKEEHLRMLAQKAREERTGASSSRDRRLARTTRSPSGSRTPSSYSGSSEEDEDSEEEATRARQEARKERRQEAERELRRSRMGQERKLQTLAKEQNRDISEKIALGLAKPTQSAESMYDSRLFNQTSSFATGFNEDQHYDKPLFATQDAISSIYRPKVNAGDDDDGEDAAAVMENITKKPRFEMLGGSKGAPAEPRDGPVQFEKDTDDPFNINAMISEATGGTVDASGKDKGKEAAGGKRYGIYRDDPEDDNRRKRARVEDEDEA